MPATHILAIDQGTTSTRAIVFDRDGRPLATAQRELPQHFPADGWVEHEGADLWHDSIAVCREALQRGRLEATAVAAIGITNQRETVLLWDRGTGEPVHRAIVWQDRRTAEQCRRLKADGAETMVREKTGLLLDPYFSATKLAWLLDQIPGARRRAERGELCFGTVDSYLLFRLSGGRVHATDATNAARTLLFNLTTQEWDAELLRLFAIPPSVLPEVRDNAGLFAGTDSALLGAALPIAAMAGDQHAAMVGQGCLSPGMIKSTYGTGCFALMHVGDQPLASKNRLLTTLAYRLDGRPHFAIEGSIFIAGAAIQWMRDGLRLIGNAAESERLARSIEDTGGVYLVPAFTGLGAPHWDPDARGALLGLTRDSGAAQLVRAALEAVCYQTRDLMDAMASDSGRAVGALRVDGGMAANDWLMQFLADILDTVVERPQVTETTALGAARLAALGVGLIASLDTLQREWKCEKRFEPSMPPVRREALYRDWQAAVRRVLSA